MVSRWLVSVPEISETTFVLLSTASGDDRSWNVRDYSDGTEMVHHARDFPPHWTARSVLESARHRIPAVTGDVHDVSFWRREIGGLNRRYLEAQWPPRPQARPTPALPGSVPRFPIPDLDVLAALPKARKPRDLERMCTSPRSEDYVTWTVSRALARVEAAVWWPILIDLADRAAGIASGLDPSGLPTVDLWRSVPSPPGYESALRQRMRGSTDAEERSRAGHPNPVEGSSEIDLAFDAPGHLVFVEAKLSSDLSPRTTHDEFRNQLIRTIDCVLEQADGRATRCWMFAADRHPTRRYMQLAARYRRDPGIAVRLLPHHPPAEVAAVVERLAVVLWAEILAAVPFDRTDDDVAAALAEVAGRV